MEGTIAEIRMFAGNFAPRDWAFCEGQLLSIAQNTALFSLLGTTFGGNGTTTFALPDFRSRHAVGTGTGPGLSPINLGQQSGSENASLTINNLPAHSHGITTTVAYLGSNAERPGISSTPVGNYYSILAGQNLYSSSQDTTLATIAAPTLGNTGGSQPVPLRKPYLGLNHIICMYGIYPTMN